MAKPVALRRRITYTRTEGLSLDVKSMNNYFITFNLSTELVTMFVMLFLYKTEI
jgi:hypothetical protein